MKIAKKIGFTLTGLIGLGLTLLAIEHLYGYWYLFLRKVPYRTQGMDSEVLMWLSIDLALLVFALGLLFFSVRSIKKG